MTLNESSLEMRSARRDVLKGALGLTAATLGASLLGPGGSAALATAATFPIRIDARRLFYRHFIIPGVTSNFVDSRTVQSFNLAPGQYSFQIASGSYADFTFRVSASGTIEYDTSYATFLSGYGGSALTIDGLPVTLDARYLSGLGVLFADIPLTNDDWISFRTVRMVPASHYRVQQGAGVVGSFTFKLAIDGRWSYNAAYDADAGGFLSGAGTPILTFYGYPLLIDARASGGDFVLLQTVWGMPLSGTSVQHACLLPAPYYALQVRSGVVSRASFSLAPNGTFVIDSGASSLLAPDTFHGLRRLRVTGPL